ncbi:MAG: ShlB/FhaC/HecB family hemolysin secretion/activation protein [Pseudomonadota bacterium]
MIEKISRCHIVVLGVWGLFLLVSVSLCSAEEISDRLDSRQPSQSRPELPEYIPKTPPEGGFVLPPAPTAPKPIAGAAMFELKGVLFEGNTVLTDDELQAVVAPFIGQRVGIGELEEIRHRLTRLYIDRGYINSGAIIRPGQTVDEGILTYTIEEGRLNRIDVTGNDRLQARYVEKRLWSDSERVFNTNALQEQFQMLLQDPLIKRMDGKIRPGAAPGEAVLDLNVTRNRPYSLSITADNQRPPSTGAERVVVSGSVQNLTGWGDMWDAAFGISEGADESALGFSIPLTFRDTLLSLRYSRNNNAVIEEPLEAIDVESESENAELSLTHPLFRNARRRLDVGVALAVRQSKTFLLGRAFSFSPGVENGISQVSAIRLVQSFVDRTRNQALALRSTVSFGVDLFGSTLHSEDLPDSRYVTWLGQMQYAHRLGERFGQILFRGDVQVASDKLLPLEQFAAGGADTVRGYRENALVRDNGCVLSLEWRYPLWKRQAAGGLEEVLQLTPFMDFGEAWNRGEDHREEMLHSVGVGLIFTPLPWMSAEVYWAHDIEERAAATAYNLQDDGVHFRVRFTIF